MFEQPFGLTKFKRTLSEAGYKTKWTGWKEFKVYVVSEYVGIATRVGKQLRYGNEYTGSDETLSAAARRAAQLAEDNSFTF